MKKLIFITMIICLAVSSAAAYAAPSTYQRFEAKVTGKAGTDKKPKPIGLYLHPYHITDTIAKTGAISEAPFATVFANIWLPKQIVFNPGSFPSCPLATALNTPDSCPKGSELGRGDAWGYARNYNSEPGSYVLAPKLKVRAFALSKNSLTLRVVSPVTGASVMQGVLTKVSGAYGWKLRFTIPRGLISPITGLVSQLVSFDAAIKSQSSKGKPFAALKACPKNKKLVFGYNGEYNIGLATGGALTNEDNFSINEIGKVITSTVKCH